MFEYFISANPAKITINLSKEYKIFLKKDVGNEKKSIHIYKGINTRTS